MESVNRGCFSADVLPPSEVVGLKALEQRNRDLGAEKYAEWLQTNRSPFHLLAETCTVLPYLRLHSDEVVLDVGCGVGRIAMVVASKVSRLVCVDLSAVSLRLLASEANTRGIHNIETVQSDLCVMPASLHSFDSVYCVDMLMSIPSHRERLIALRCCNKALKPGGRFLVSVYCWNFRNQEPGIEKEGFWGSGDRQLYRYYFTPQELRSLLQEAGFRNVRLRGQIILPARLTQYLPSSLAVVENWCSMIPCFSGIGRYVIAIGRK